LRERRCGLRAVHQVHIVHYVHTCGEEVICTCLPLLSSGAIAQEMHRELGRKAEATQVSLS